MSPELYDRWIQAKEAERVAVEKRREIEDLLTETFELPGDFEGTKVFDGGKYRVKVVGRLAHKVDSEKLDLLAHEAGLVALIPSLFRIKHEIDLKAWRSAKPEITGPLSGAITTTANRPSYTVERVEE